MPFINLEAFRYSEKKTDRTVIFNIYMTISLYSL